MLSEPLNVSQGVAADDGYISLDEVAASAAAAGDTTAASLHQNQTTGTTRRVRVTAVVAAAIGVVAVVAIVAAIATNSDGVSGAASDGTAAALHSAPVVVPESSEASGSLKYIQVDCSTRPDGVWIQMQNTDSVNVKIRTCNSDYCQGNPDLPNAYEDCDYELPPHGAIRWVRINLSAHYLVFAFKQTEDSHEFWKPAAGWPDSVNIFRGMNTAETVSAPASVAASSDINCSTEASVDWIYMRNDEADNVKIRSCNSDYCQGNPALPNPYHDCDLELVGSGVQTFVRVNHDAHYLVFVFKGSQDDVEYWKPANGWPESLDVFRGMGGVSVPDVAAVAPATGSSAGEWSQCKDFSGHFTPTAVAPQSPPVAGEFFQLNMDGSLDEELQGGSLQVRLIDNTTGKLIANVAQIDLCLAGDKGHNICKQPAPLATRIVAPLFWSPAYGHSNYILSVEAFDDTHSPVLCVSYNFNA